ncbi:unnamed protein product [Paramecium pentaurelia]|uniref:Uncharacterized protein n=1 Tax=Paramecium pentaurelia TaxID=43138 RepID=A0A8S1THS0_9CILI|nr:unnamed protein product [Paramecium pentaurelia]
MSTAQYSLDPPLHTSLFYNIEINNKFQDFLYFEPIHIVSQKNKYYNIKKEIKLTPTINYDNNSSMYYKIQVQKMRVKKARQSKSNKYQKIPDLLDYNSCLRIIQPNSMSVKVTQRKYSQPKRLPTKSFCQFSSSNEQQSKEHTKINIRLPNIEKNQLHSPSKNSLNCWTRNTSSSLLQIIQ